MFYEARYIITGNLQSVFHDRGEHDDAQEITPSSEYGLLK